MECVICIEKIENTDLFTINSCKHEFHESCILEWMKQKNECPICRSMITPETQSTVIITDDNIRRRIVVYRLLICLSVSMLSNMLISLYLNSTAVILWILLTILSLKSPALLKFFSFSGFILVVLLFHDLIKYIINQKNIYDTDEYSSTNLFPNLFWYILPNTVLMTFIIIQSYTMHAIEACMSRTHIIQEM